MEIIMIKEKQLGLYSKWNNRKTLIELFCRTIPLVAQKNKNEKSPRRGIEPRSGTRQAPILTIKLSPKKQSTHDGGRTHNLLIRSQTRCHYATRATICWRFYYFIIVKPNYAFNYYNFRIFTAGEIMQPVLHKMAALMRTDTSCVPLGHQGVISQK